MRAGVRVAGQQGLCRHVGHMREAGKGADHTPHVRGQASRAQPIASSVHREEGEGSGNRVKETQVDLQGLLPWVHEPRRDGGTIPEYKACLPAT